MSEMKLVVISPERDDPRERDVVAALFAAGLDRYHVRKPHASVGQLEAWLRGVPVEWRGRIVLHQHHELVASLGLGGTHAVGRGLLTPPHNADRSVTKAGSGDPALQVRSVSGRVISRSCHTLAELRASLGPFDSVFFSPVFPSLSKPGYGPREDSTLAEVSALLARRTAAERRTSVLALGGITAETAPRALALGFDGVAALGAIWSAADPTRAFVELQNSLVCHAA